MSNIQTKLTEEQKKLIEDNLSFMYWWFNKHHIYDEDLQQSLICNFCDLIRIYDPKRGAITTFIDLINKTKVDKINRRDIKRQAFEKFTTSIDDYACRDVGEFSESSYTWKEVIGDIDFDLDRLEEKDFCRYLLKKIKESDKIKKKDFDILTEYLNLGNQSAVGRKFGVARQQILRVMTRIRKEVMAKGWVYE